MRHVVPIVMTVMLFAAGCARQTGTAASKAAAEPPVTESTEQTAASGTQNESSAPPDEAASIPSGSAAGTEQTSQTGEPADKVKLLQDYSALKAELDALDIDMDRLETEFLAQKMDENTYKAQKLELKQKEDTLELQKDRLKLDLKSGARTPQLPEGTAEELLSRLRKLESDEEELDLKEHMLEADYRSGAITREDFISQQTELLILDEQNDWEKDFVEDALEIMGIDD